MDNTKEERQAKQKELVDRYRDTDNPVVRVSDAYAAAAGKYGLGADALSYGNGTVSIGGQPLNTLYIDDSGKAWARQKDVERLTTEYANKTGVTAPGDISAKYEKKYLADIRDAVSDLRNRKEFSYNPDDDPVYAAYRKKYLLEGNRASENAMADYSALTGGYVNSAAVTAGAQANQYYAQQLSNTVPQLAEQAYRRYLDSYQTDLDVLGRMIDLYDKAYDNELAANRQTLENANSSAKSAVQRDKDAYEHTLSEEERYWRNRNNETEEEALARERYWDELFNAQEYETGGIKKEGATLDNQKAQIYLEYYKRLLESELANDSADRAKKVAEINKLYAG